MATTSASPLSSPRLPSPPPMAEIQLGPKSPSPGTEEQQKLLNTLDNGASRRIRPGTKAEDMAEGPPLVDLSEIDSAFQLTEHLKALHNFLTHPIGTNTVVPVDRDMALKLAHPPENVDKTLWLYELCRFLTQKVNAIIIALFSDAPPCSSATCPEMRASEWQYLCAVHDPPKSCGAIDYSCHTLDWAANTLTSPKNFPSRLAMGTDHSTQHQQIRNLTNIFRRVYRIFAHAWFQHREMFWKVEGRTGLYVFFKTVCDVYGLIPEDNYTIPPEAEGIEESAEAKSAVQTPLILKRDPSGPGPAPDDNGPVLESGDRNLTAQGTSTTKRHRQSPTVSLNSVSTVMEENEEDEEAQEQPAKDTSSSLSKEQQANEPSQKPSPGSTDAESATEQSKPADQENDTAGDESAHHATEDAATEEAAADSEANTQTAGAPSETEEARQEDGSASQAAKQSTQATEQASETPGGEQEKNPTEENPTEEEEKAEKTADSSDEAAAGDPDKESPSE